MAAGQQRHQRLLDNFFLAEDHRIQPLAHAGEGVGRRREASGGFALVQNVDFVHARPFWGGFLLGTGGFASCQLCCTVGRKGRNPGMPLISGGKSSNCGAMTAGGITPGNDRLGTTELLEKLRGRPTQQPPASRRGHDDYEFLTDLLPNGPEGYPAVKAAVLLPLIQRAEPVLLFTR